jgi:hypothetical protein
VQNGGGGVTAQRLAQAYKVAGLRVGL